MYIWNKFEENNELKMCWDMMSILYEKYLQLINVNACKCIGLVVLEPWALKEIYHFYFDVVFCG